MTDWREQVKANVEKAESEELERNIDTIANGDYRSLAIKLHKLWQSAMGQKTNEWMDIKTAPKDKPVLVYADITVGNLAEFGQSICVAKFDHIADLKSGKRSVFLYAQGHSDQNNRSVIPSHWMPLPEPTK